MSLYGFDQTSLPIFLASSDDADAVARWKAEHPDWFVAGTWTGRRATAAPLAGETNRFRDGSQPPGAPRSLGCLGLAVETVATPLDPSTISLADFHNVVAAARVSPSRGDGNPDVILAQAGPPRFRPRGPGGRFVEESIAEEMLRLRFGIALRRIAQFEPNNRLMEYVSDPDRAPSESVVQKYEREAEAARLRAQPTPPAGNADKRENHHIVPQGGAGMTGRRDPSLAQQFLRELELDLEAPENGVVLSEAFHRRLHTSAYYNYVNRLLMRAKSLAEMQKRLEVLSRKLQDADRTYQQTGVMPDWSEDKP